MKNIVILFIAFLIIINTNYAQKVKSDTNIVGHIICKGEHVPFINVFIKGTTTGTYTDGTGHYMLTDLPEGKHIIRVQAIGYKSKEKEIEIHRNETKELNFEIDEDLMMVEQVVITGTRTPHYIKDVPIRTEVITAREIETKNASNIYEVLEGTPGIRVEQQCQFCNFSMIRMQGLGSEHTQVLLNGQPIYSGLAAIYGLQQIGTVDVDRVEVVKGAGSALYGSSAVAGAINIISKEPSFEPTTKSTLQFGSYNTNKYDIYSSIKNKKGNLGLNIFAQKITGDAIDETQDGETQDDIRHADGISDRVEQNLSNAGFSLYIYDLLSKRDKLIVRGKYVNEFRQGGKITDGYFTNPLTDGTERIITDRYESELSYNKIFSEKSEINLSLAYTKHKRNATNDSFLGDYMDTHGDSVPDLRIMRPYIADENVAATTMTYGLTLNKHHLLMGIQTSMNKLDESGKYVVAKDTLDDGITPNPNFGEAYTSNSYKKATEFGIFVQDEWSLSKNLQIVPGVRYDLHNSEEEYKAAEIFATNLFPKTKFDEISINPRLAIKYEISKRITLRANAGTGFRAPYGFSEDLHLCSGSPRVWKSSSLKPETSVSYNFSADYYGKKVKVSANIFRTDLKDKIAFADADENVSAMGYDYQWENINDAFVQGIELSFMANVAKDLGFGIDFTFNKGEYINPRGDWVDTRYEDISMYISRFPMSTSNFKIEYSPKQWNFALIGNYTGKMYIDYFAEDEVSSKIKKTEGFVIFNARISKQFKAVKIYASVNNLTDYIQPEKHTDDAAFMYAPIYGRMFYAGISLSLRKY